jgi:hypothetical protein
MGLALLAGGSLISKCLHLVLVCLLDLSVVKGLGEGEVHKTNEGENKRISKLILNCALRLNMYFVIGPKIIFC